MQAKSPTNVTELNSYLGLLNYYGKFLPNLATTLHPLHDLLQKARPWKWTEACVSAFVKSKKQLQDSPLLVHYDLKKSLRLACDASPYGVGAVLSHVMENGKEKPIAFASRTLTAREHSYSQIEKEASSIVLGVKSSIRICMVGGLLLNVLYRPPRRFLPSKCWMAKQIRSVWSIGWSTLLF